MNENRNRPDYNIGDYITDPVLRTRYCAIAFVSVHMIHLQKGV